MDIYHKILQQYWGYTVFRPLQEDIIHSIVEGKDTLGLMPTGGGKSLTFQVPTMCMEGLCLVVTPLIALMKDQVDNLKQRGIKALAVYSSMTNQEIITTLENAILGDYKFLYVSPERLSTDLFISKLKSMTVCLLVVDESHCISQWGYDFRPSYLQIADVRAYFPHVPVLALTATATADVIDDIQNRLHFSKKNVYKKSFERGNIAYIVRHTEDKEASLVSILEGVEGSTIVYVRSRLRTKEISDYLNVKGFLADYYHAGLSGADKDRKQIAWKRNESRIIVCTNAFGMGIDKPDVRLVVHIDLPNSVEEYFQEAGRAGRDEQKAYAIILYMKSDSTKLKKRIADEFPDRDFIVRVYEALAYFFQVAEGFGADTLYDFNLHRFCGIYKLPLLPTHNALKIIGLAGFIEYIDEVNNRSRLKFTVRRDELYHYQTNKEYEILINTILRLYTGLFVDYATIDEAAIAVRIHQTRKEVYEMLKKLSKNHIIHYIPHKKTPLVAYIKARVSPKNLSISPTIYEHRRDRFEARIAAITGYAERHDICRSRLLLAYFGETETINCRQCDVCLAKNDAGLTNNRFNDIAQDIHSLLEKEERNSIDITHIMDSLAHYLAIDVTTVIRLLVDRGELILTLGKVSIPNG